MTSSGETSPVSVTPSGTPLSTQAPKYGTLIPNRIFVGGIAASTNEQELKQFFSAYGAVKDCKIILDRAGVSKGYGFVTFETQEDADKIIKKEADNLIFKDRKLNIGPAIRKQQAFPRIYEPSMSPGGTILYSNVNGVPYTFQNGMAIFQPPEGYAVPTQPQAAYPVMIPAAGNQPAYVSQPAFQYQSPTAAPAHQWQTQWRWTPQSPTTPVAASHAGQYMYTAAMQAMPDMMQYQHAAYQQPTDLSDVSMMEAAPAEGSIIMEGHTSTRCVEGHPSRYQDGQMPTLAHSSYVGQNTVGGPPIGEQQSPIPQVMQKTTYAMKRVAAPPQIINTPPTPYSPMTTPPLKVMQGNQGQRMITKTVNGTTIGVIPKDPLDKGDQHYGELGNSCPLTPPPTPQADTCQ